MRWRGVIDEYRKFLPVTKLELKTLKKSKRPSNVWADPIRIRFANRKSTRFVLGRRMLPRGSTLSTIDAIAAPPVN